MKKSSVDNTEIAGGIILNSKFIPKKNLPSGTLRIVLTSKCNFNCLYCFNEGEDKLPRELDLEIIKRVIKNSLQFGISSIKLTGGEPLLYPYLEDLLRYIREETNIKYIDITTNISLLDLKKISLLNKYQINAVTMSLDSLSEIDFNELTQSKSYGPTISNLNLAIRKFKGLKRINYVALNRKTKDYLKVIKFCLENNLGLRICEPTTVKGKKITADKRGFRRVKNYLRKNCNKVIKSMCSSVSYYYFGKKYITTMSSLCDNKLCKNCKDYMYIRLTSDGRLRPCLARQDNAVNVSDFSDEETQKAFIQVINQMGEGR